MPDYTEREGGLPVIYHGTPLTPRAAFNSVMPGRAACVSFFRPDDLEAVLAVCPQAMFRPRGVQLLDAGDARRSRMGRGRPSTVVAGLLRLAGTEPVSSGAVGDHAGQSCGADPAQRWASERLAIRGSRGAGLAYGRACRETGEAVRSISPCLCRVDRRSETRAGGLRGLLSQDGRGCQADGQHVAPAAYATRHPRRSGVSVHQRGQHLAGAERASL